MEFFRLKETDTLHIVGASYASPYEAERKKEEQDEERTTRRASDRAVSDRIDQLKRKSLENLCGIHETLMLRAHAIHTGQPVPPLEPTADEQLLCLRQKYSLDFGTALFEFLKFKAITDRKHGMLRPKLDVRGRVTCVTHVTDSDDHIQDLYLDVWQQEQRGDFRGVDDNGQPANFLHWLNKIYANHFNTAVTKRFKVDKINRQIYAKETLETEKPPAYEGCEQAPKRSEGWGSEATPDGSRFSPLDPNKHHKLWAIVDVLTRTYPGIAALLSQGLTYREVSERLGIKYSKLTRSIRKAKDEIEAAGITKRETGRVYRKPNKRATKPEVGAEIAVIGHQEADKYDQLPI